MLALPHLMHVVVDYLGSETFSPNHFLPISANLPFSFNVLSPSLKSDTTLSSTSLLNVNADLLCSAFPLIALILAFGFCFII